MRYRGRSARGRSDRGPDCQEVTGLEDWYSYQSKLDRDDGEHPLSLHHGVISMEPSDTIWLHFNSEVKVKTIKSVLVRRNSQNQLHTQRINRRCRENHIMSLTVLILLFLF